MILQQSATLACGLAIPKVGLGTWQLHGQTVVEAVKAALAAGYRHIDTAAAYENEAEVARGIRESGLDRQKVFVTTKIPAEVKTYAGAKQSIADSLAKLGGPIDLMLIHAPRPWDEMGQTQNRYFAENRQVWQAMEEAQAAGQLRALGVSNFDAEDLDNILQGGRQRPQVDQISIHIGRTDLALIEYCRKQGLLVQAYAPNATGALSQNAAVVAMAQKYGVSVPQLGSRYALQLGTLPLPRSQNPAHIRENAQLDFVISEEDMAQLTAMRD